MDVYQLGVRAGIIFAAVLAFWIFFKVLSFIWKAFFIVLVILALSFALPAVREWIFGIF